MTKKELNLIVEILSKSIVENVPLLVRKIVREELQLNGLLNERVETPIKKQTINKRRQSNIQNTDEFRQILETTKPKIQFPTTGNKILDDIIMSTPKEEDIAKKEIYIPKEKPIPLEDLYLNDVKKVSVDIAENIDYSDMLSKMEGSSGISAPIGVNPKSLYFKDKSSIIEEQRIGETKIVKQYKG